jgi:hypothetical protein
MRIKETELKEDTGTREEIRRSLKSPPRDSGQKETSEVKTLPRKKEMEELRNQSADHIQKKVQESMTKTRKKCLQLSCPEKNKITNSRPIQKRKHNS